MDASNPDAGAQSSPRIDFEASSKAVGARLLPTVTDAPFGHSTRASGQYQGQRNVAFCLSDGCSGAIRVNKILGCAWRFVILESGHFSIDTTDTSNLQYYCGQEHIDKAGLMAAEAQAKRILKMLGN